MMRMSPLFVAKCLCLILERAGGSRSELEGEAAGPMAQRGSLFALRALLLLCIASSCSPHDWFSTPARAPGSGGARPSSPHAVGSPPLPMQRLYLDYHRDRVAGEELRRAGAHQWAAGATGPGRREGRRRTLASASAQNDSNPAGSRGGAQRAATAGHANASASAGPRMDRGEGAASSAGKIGRRGRPGAVELGARGRRRKGQMLKERKGGGESQNIVVAGAGLEEAVVGEPAEGIVEVSGWSKVCAEA